MARIGFYAHVVPHKQHLTRRGNRIRYRREQNGTETAPAARSDHKNHARPSVVLRIIQVPSSLVCNGTTFDITLKLSSVLGLRSRLRILIESNDTATTEIGRRRVGKECRSRWSPYH